MSSSHEEYIEAFMAIGEPLLKHWGYVCTVLPPMAPTHSPSLLIRKEHHHDSILTFATIPPSPSEGVVIGDALGGSPFRDAIRIPNRVQRRMGMIYEMTGPGRDAAIARIARNLIHFNLLRASMRHVPFDYCSEEAHEQGLTCPSKQVKSLGSKPFGEMRLHYYQCKICQGYWKRCIGETSEVWLKVGENSGHKHPGLGMYLTFFRVEEAMEYGLEIACGQLESFDSYHGLQCVPRNLRLVKNVSKEEGGGVHLKVDIFRCSICGRTYKIVEEFDCSKGTWRGCIQIGGSTSAWGRQITFDLHEVADTPAD